MIEKSAQLPTLGPCQINPWNSPKHLYQDLHLPSRLSYHGECAGLLLSPINNSAGKPPGLISGHKVDMASGLSPPQVNLRSM